MPGEKSPSFSDRRNRVEADIPYWACMSHTVTRIRLDPHTRPDPPSPATAAMAGLKTHPTTLVLDPKTVCVEASEVWQAEQLDKLGFEVIPVELRDAYAFGGGLHCCTADVYREGGCEDYFGVG